MGETAAIETSKPLAWANLWAAMEAQPKARIPTTERMFEDMLAAVPPHRMNQETKGLCAFLVGEAADETASGEFIYACFTRNQIDSQLPTYSAMHMTTREFNATFS